MIYFPNAPTCPPLQGNTEASKGFELWPPPVLGRQKPKNGKPFQERARAAAVAPEPAILTGIRNQQRSGRGGILSLFIYGGGYDKWFELASLRANSNHLSNQLYKFSFIHEFNFIRIALCLCVGVYTGGWVCARGYLIKNDNRYGRVQKIDPRNTLRGMKTKETIFLKQSLQK